MAKKIIIAMIAIIILTFTAFLFVYEEKEVMVEIKGIEKSVFTDSFEEWLVEQNKDIRVLKINNFERFDSLKKENQLTWFSYDMKGYFSREFIDTFIVSQWFYWNSPEYIIDSSGNNLIVPGEEAIVFYEESHKVDMTIMGLSHNENQIIVAVNKLFLLILILTIILLITLMSVSSVNTIKKKKIMTHIFPK
ncbi:MAG: hypothetical protein PHX92_01865 [Candidatus Pacebacteria bacterium]|nr:hypothetical protein [Candidatus Paceibacterota bacterium]